MNPLYSIPNLDDYISKLALFINYNKYTKGQAVYQYQGEVEKLHFIIKGEVELFYHKNEKQLQKEQELLQKLQESSQGIQDFEAGSQEFMTAKVNQLEFQRKIQLQKEFDKADILELQHLGKPKYFRKE